MTAVAVRALASVGLGGSFSRCLWCGFGGSIVGSTSWRVCGGDAAAAGASLAARVTAAGAGFAREVFPSAADLEQLLDAFGGLSAMAEPMDGPVVVDR